ncbi:MAG TPA: hypothetical protein VFU98_03305 [Microlunatus sp.]|nr:hypothetical protein [Microlunatus sp.]
MSSPLTLSYNWQAHLGFATIALTVCLGLLFRGRPAGWLSTGVVLVLFWAVYCAIVWLRSRAYLLIEGPLLTTRHWRRLEQVEGDQVRTVKELLTPAGPSYRLQVERAGAPEWVTVPTAVLRGGQSTLFAWILAQAPGATLDKRSLRTLELLQTKGLVG